jgi:hypothetical protein
MTFLVAGLLILTVSCGRQQLSNERFEPKITNPTVFKTPTEINKPIPTISPSGIEPIVPSNVVPQRTKYDLQLFYDHTMGILKVEEQVTYFNNSQENLEVIPLILPFKPDHVFKLGEVLINKSQPEVQVNGNTLLITLIQRLRVGELISLSINYEITIPETGGVLGRTNRQINLADFYPMIPPYRSIDSWIIHEPGKVGEHLVYDVADFDLEFSTNTPGEFQIFSNAPITKNPSAYAVSAEKYRNIVISMCFDCSKIEFDLGTFKVIGGFDTQDEETGKEVLDIIARALVFFSDRFGVAYPHPEMTILEADFPDGMEYDGLFFLSKDYFDQYDQSFMNYLSLLSVHETAHQWWFGLVANDQAMEPWLDEALATYSEYLFLEEFYPELTSWWWNFRVNSYNPTGSIGSTIYEFDSTRTYINAVYLRGAVFLHELRTLLTDDFFFDRLVRYTKNYTGLISSGEAFKNIFVPDMADSETDLIEEFFDQ